MKRSRGVSFLLRQHELNSNLLRSFKISYVSGVSNFDWKINKWKFISIRYAWNNFCHVFEVQMGTLRHRKMYIELHHKPIFFSNIVYYNIWTYFIHFLLLVKYNNIKSFWWCPSCAVPARFVFVALATNTVPSNFSPPFRKVENLTTSTSRK